MQQICEQMVVSVPLFVIVKRHEKEIALLQVFENFLRAFTRLSPVQAHKGAAQGTVELLQDGGFQEEGLDVSRLSLQHLLHEVVQYIAVAAGEVPNKLGGILMSLEREGCHLQSNHPAFRASLEGLNILTRQAQ